MKINHTIVSASGLEKAQEAAASGASSRAPTHDPGSKADRLQLSSLGSHLSALHSNSAQRSATVAELRSAVSSGRYHVDPQQVSKKLIEEHLAA
jgi:flagellar biosynthesis anti-sigma factor FlgM